MKKKIGIAILSIGVIIQFFRIDQVNPEVVIENDFIVLIKPDTKTEQLLRASCYDCHSNTTEYPWYANLAPVSWWIKDNINEAKSHLNFSEWTKYSKKKQLHKLHECYEEVENGQMPLENYTLMHAEAKLSHEEREHLEGFFKSFGPFEDAD